MSDDALPPRLAGEAARIVREAARRQDVEPLHVRADVATVTLTDPDQIAALALASLIARELVRAGGTRLRDRPLDRALAALWRVLEPDDRVDLEIDAHAALDWLARAYGAPLPAPKPPPDTVTPDSSHERVVRWAIEHGEDLNIELWDAREGSLDAMRVTPIRLEAGHYLRVFDYKLGDTRVVRLHHLGEVRPVHGWPRAPEGAAAPPLPIEAYADEGPHPRRPVSDLELPEVPADHDPDSLHADSRGQILMFDEEE